MPPTLVNIGEQLIWSAQNMASDLARGGLPLVIVTPTHHLKILSGLTANGVHFETNYHHGRFLKLNMDYDDQALVGAFSNVLEEQPVVKYITRYTLPVTQREREAIHYWWAADKFAVFKALRPITDLIDYQEL